MKCVCYLNLKSLNLFENLGRYIFRAWRGDDFEDEVCFKWGRVVTPRFSVINFIILIFNKFQFYSFISLFI